VRTRAAVVGCRNGGRAADGTRSHPGLREETYMRRARGHVEAEKAKAFTNGSALNGAAFTGLFPAPIPTTCLCSYCVHSTTNRANLPFPFWINFSPGLFPRLTTGFGRRTRRRTPKKREASSLDIPPCHQHHVTNCFNYTKAFPEPDCCVR
jgi:hypothetical protein